MFKTRMDHRKIVLRRTSIENMYNYKICIYIHFHIISTHNMNT